MQKQYVILSGSTVEELVNKVNEALKNPLCQLQGGVISDDYAFRQALIISFPNEKEDH